MERQVAAQLQSRLRDKGFALVRDERHPDAFGDRVIELARGPLRIRIATDRGDPYVELGGPDGTWWDVDLWRAFAERKTVAGDHLSFVSAAHYVVARLEALEAIATDPAFTESSARLKDLALDRADRLFPGTDMRLQEHLAGLAEELGDVTIEHQDPDSQFARSGLVFATYSPGRALEAAGSVELRVGIEIAHAARRTPDSRPSPRGDDWVGFEPREWDKHATDRVDAWFRVAWRAAGKGPRAG